MSDPVLIALIASLPTLLGAYLSYAAGRRKSVSEATLAQEANDREDEKNAVAGWQTLAAEYRADRLRTQSELEALRKDFESLRATVHELEQERDAHRSWRRLALDYMRTLVGALRAHDLTPPAPPAGLAVEDAPPP